MMRISITVYDDHRKVFQRTKVSANAGMIQTGNFLRQKMGMPMKVITTKKKTKKKK